MRSIVTFMSGRTPKLIKYLLLGAMLCPTLLFAQNKTLTGVVIDETSQPLPGVSVTVKNVAGGTQTDASGKFSITAPQGAVLVFSYVGYEKQQVTVAAANTYNISLKPASNSLREVVVSTGYTTMKQRDATASIASAPIKDMIKAPTLNIAEMLQGRVAGVQVSSPDGTPGAAPNIQIRGITSVTGSNNPLYVIDGVIQENPNLAVISPEDIESMDILKDAAGTALYGFRGSAGVIVITTKRGKNGPPVVSFDMYMGAQKVSKKIPLMNAYDYIKMQHERDSLSNNYAFLVDPITGKTSTTASKYYATDYTYGIPQYSNFKLGAVIPQYGAAYPLGDPRNLEKYQNAQTLDLQNFMYTNSFFQNYNLSVRGGTDKTRYSISGNTANQDGIIVNTGFKRYTGRIVLDQTVSNKVTVGINTNYAYTQSWGGSTNQSNQSGYFGSLGAPTYGVYGYRPVTALDSLHSGTSDLETDLIDPAIRTLNNAQSNNLVNPVIQQQNQVIQSITKYFTANGYVTYKILPSLTLKISGGITTNDIKNINFYNILTKQGYPNPSANGVPQNPNGVNGSINFISSNNWINSNNLTYQKDFNVDHHFSATAVVEESGVKGSSYGVGAVNIQNPSLGIVGLSTGTPTAIIPQSGNNYNNALNHTVLSYLAIVNYNYKNRYYISGTAREDGSSVFASANHFEFFPSISGKWRFSDEDFMKGTQSILSDGSIRASYGSNGNNQGIGEFPYLTQITSNSATSPSGNYVFNGVQQVGYFPSTLANAGLKWETDTKLNIATELSFLNNRINFVGEVYRNRSNNLLLNASLPTSLGYPTVYANVGSMQNQGLELTFNTINVQTKNFTWSSSFNITWNQNKLLSLAQGQESLPQTIAWDETFKSGIVYINKVGQPLGQMYGYVFDGTYKYSDFNYTPSLNATAGAPGIGSHYVLKDNVPTNGNARAIIQPGDIKYKDLNGDGVVNSNDETIIGRGQPIHTGGFGNNFRYKNFDLNLFFQWSYGNNIENANRYIFQGNFTNAPAINQFASFNDRWTPQNSESNIPRLYGQGPAGYYSSRVIEDGSYLRLKTAQLGYTLPKSLLQKINIKTFRVWISGQNIWTWTKYTGQDPEVSSYNNVLTPNFDWSSYARARTLVMGANITF